MWLQQKLSLTFHLLLSLPGQACVIPLIFGFNPAGWQQWHWRSQHHRLQADQSVRPQRKHHHVSWTPPNVIGTVSLINWTCMAVIWAHEVYYIPLLITGTPSHPLVSGETVQEWQSGQSNQQCFSGAVPFLPLSSSGSGWRGIAQSSAFPVEIFVFIETKLLSLPAAKKQMLKMRFLPPSVCVWNPNISWTNRWVLMTHQMHTFTWFIFRVNKIQNGCHSWLRFNSDSWRW